MARKTGAPTRASHAKSKVIVDADVNNDNEPEPSDLQVSVELPDTPSRATCKRAIPISLTGTGLEGSQDEQENEVDVTPV